MSRPTYTFEQLKRLRNSPLVRKPEHLPPIEQWIEQSTDQARRTARTQGGTTNGRPDENDQPAKRPSLFDTRHLSRQSNTGEEVFLGPKISFASASAARQPGKSVPGEDRSTTTQADEPRNRQDRGQPRERGFRDREVRENNDRYRAPERANGHQEGGVGNQRKAPELFQKGRSRLEDGEDATNDEDSRRPAGRGKLDQPWFRKGDKPELKDGDGFEEKGNDRGWRGGEKKRTEPNWVRDDRAEQDPQWMTEPSMADMACHTQEDFQAWKDKMKASNTTADKSPVEDISATPPAAKISTPPTELVRGADKSDNVFNMWADPKRDESSSDLSTPKTTAKPKSSRFAGFFGPSQQEPQKPAPHPEPVSSPPIVNPAKQNTEDQIGFERVMDMLRSKPQSSSAQVSAPPSSEKFAHDGQLQQAPPAAVENRMPETQQFKRQSITAPAPMMAPQQQLPPQPPTLLTASRPEPISRSSETLLKIVQAHQFQQPRPGQIYGQQYNRRDNNDISSILNNYMQPPQPQPQPQPQPPVLQAPAPKPRGPPPGFFGNDKAFSANQHIEGQYMHEPLQSQPHMDDRLPGPSQRHPAHDLRFQQPPTYDQASHVQPNRAQQHTQEPLPPPPGFANAHGPAPPGFYPFPGNGNIPQGMRAGPMPQQPPPPFYGNQGVPAGYPGPQQQQQQLQQQQAQTRRLSQMQGQMQMPQGYEAYLNIGRGGPGPGPGPGPGLGMQMQMPLPGQYPQYMKQNGPARY